MRTIDIRRDQVEQAKKRLRKLIEEGLNSGPGRAFTPQRAAQLKKQALGKRHPGRVEGAR